MVWVMVSSSSSILIIVLVPSSVLFNIPLRFIRVVDSERFAVSPSSILSSRRSLSDIEGIV